MPENASTNHIAVDRFAGAFAERLQSDPELAAAVARCKARLDSPEMRRWFADFAAAHTASLDEIESKHLPRPEDLEGWEHLARVIEMPADLIRSGRYSYADVQDAAHAWSERQRAIALIARDAVSSATTEPAVKSSRKRKRPKGAPQQYKPADDRELLADWQAAKRQGATRETFCQARDISVQDLTDARHRDNYRRKRD
jgi:hypothetical protein